jgi:hypothetical protein
MHVANAAAEEAIGGPFPPLEDVKENPPASKVPQLPERPRGSKACMSRTLLPKKPSEVPFLPWRTSRRTRRPVKSPNSQSDLAAAKLTCGALSCRAWCNNRMAGRYFIAPSVLAACARMSGSLSFSTPSAKCAPRGSGPASAKAVSAEIRLANLLSFTPSLRISHARAAGD